MFLFFSLSCATPDTPPERFDPPTRHALRSVRACAVLADDSPHDPYRLVFLHRTDPDGVDAQAELFAFDTSGFKCGEVALALVPGSDGTPVFMDFMPGADPVTIRELRLYRFDATWNPDDPFVLATEDHRPFLDYVFRVNLVLPPWNDDRSTILLR